MTERSYFWGGSYTGDAVYGHDNEEYNSINRRLVSVDRRYQGVVAHVDDPLAVSNPAGATIRIAPGSAMVDGTYYENDANLDLTIAGAAGFYLVVLRKSTEHQTIRAAIRAGIEGSASSPRLTPTQIANDIWEIPLAKVELDSAGSVAQIIDQRDYIMAPQGASLIERQGSANNDWTFPGSTDYDANSSFEQHGVVSVSFGASDDVLSVEIIFPVEYRIDPLVFVTNQRKYPTTSTQAGGYVRSYASSISTTGFTINVVRPTTGSAGYHVVAWSAIGER